MRTSDCHEDERHVRSWKQAFACTSTKEKWAVVANSEHTYEPRELSEVELELVSGDINWGSVFKTAVSAVYTAAGAVFGPAGAFVGKVVGDAAGQAAAEGAAYGDANPSVMM
jgi:hypothetical protein